MAAALKNEPGVDVQVVDGDHGEFTVLLDGQVIAQKNDSLPTVNQVLDKIRKAKSAA